MNMAAVEASLSRTIVTRSGRVQRRRCSLCDRTFTRTEHLERHVRSHTREKPFRCDKCDKTYSRHDTLLRHKRVHLELGNVQIPLPSQQNANQEGISLFDPSRQSLSDTQASETVSFACTGDGIHHFSPANVDDGLSHCTAQPLLVAGSGSSIRGNDASPQMQSPDVMIGDGPAAFSQFNGSYLDVEFNDEMPAWLTDFTADLDALSSSFSSSITNSGYAWPSHSFGDANAGKTPHPDLEQIWFTRMSGSSSNQPHSGTITPEQSQTQTEIDEDYRRTLRRRLQINAFDLSLPSSDFLNLSIRSYFARFHPIYPVIHAPTFCPSKTNSLLLLSICSVGSLFTGSANGAMQGTQIFERLNKAILATWEQLMARHTAEATPMVQAALIGQTFGMLSGDPKHLATVEAFHGVVISWARSGKMFQIRHDSLPEFELDAADLDARWRQWAKQEELIRIVLGLHIHDAELANIFHHEPFLRHSKGQLPQAAEDNVFMASKPQEWLSLFKQSSSASVTSRPFPALRNGRTWAWNQSIRDQGSFNAYVRLQCISAAITEERRGDHLEASSQKGLVDDLIDFHQEHPLFNLTQAPDPLGISILWHLSFISLCIDFDLLEQAIGRDGPRIAAENHEKITSWAASLEARRSIVHMQLIRKKLEAFPVCQEPAIHIPRAIFLVAICWYCAFHYASDCAVVRPIPLEFPEIKMLGLNSNTLIFEASGYKNGSPTTMEANEVLCRFADLLQRLGHWEIARKFAFIIGAMIHPNSS